MTSLEARISADMVAAMKAGNKDVVTTLRMAIGALRNEKVAGKQARELTEADEIRVLTSEVNKRKDSAEAYTAGHRPELADRELAEAALIQTYLPTPLTDAELDALVMQAIADAAASTGEAPTMKQMGAIIKAVNGEAAGRADGGTIAAKVRAALS